MEFNLKLRSSVHFMLPRKRPFGGQAVEEVDDEEVVEVSHSVTVNFKKPRPISTTCATTGAPKTTTATATGVSNGLSISGNGVGSESNSSVMKFGDGTSGNSMDIDEDLHSRQLAVYGRETMRKLFASNVLVSGLQGLGAEIGRFFLLFCDSLRALISGFGVDISVYG